MTVTLRHLSGTREPLDIVIGAHLQDNWDTANITDADTPVIEPITYLPQMDVDEDYAVSANMIRISAVKRYRTDDDESEPHGDDSHYWKTDVIIDIWAESITKLQEYEDEINRILWEIRPNENTRLNKSDGVEATLSVGASASEVESFDKTELNWEYLGTDEDNNGVVSSQGVIICNWFKLKT